MKSFGGLNSSPRFGVHPMEAETIDRVLAQTGIDLGGALGVPQTFSFETLRDRELEEREEDFDFD